MGEPITPPQRSVILDAKFREHAGCEPIPGLLAGHGKLDDPHRDKLGHLSSVPVES